MQIESADNDAACDDGTARLREVLDRIQRRSNKAYARRPEAVDVAAIRFRIGMTQEQFAARFGLSVATLRHWERGDRVPRGPARVLLNVIAHAPALVLRVLQRSEAG